MVVQTQIEVGCNKTDGFVMTNIRKLAVCLLNISEASNKSLVERIARSAVVKQDDHQLETTILNVFSDEIYNRSVITIAGTYSIVYLVSRNSLSKEHIKSKGEHKHIRTSIRTGAYQVGWLWRKIQTRLFSCLYQKMHQDPEP